MLMAKKKSNFMHGFKSAILEKLKIAKMAPLNPCMKFDIFLSKSIMKMAIRKNIRNLSQGPPN